MAGAAPAPAWIWGPRTDLAVFGGSALVAVALALAGPWLSPSGAAPLWAWLALVVGVDVAHVHTTLFRTYLDRDELAKRPALYVALPLACFAAGVALHLASGKLFWRVLAYVAVFHFVRQQVGWVAIYRARAGERGRVTRVLDDATIYLATGWPLLHWHAHLPRPFRWFVEDDFVVTPLAKALERPALALYVGVAIAYVATAIVRAARGGGVQVGKHVVVVGTALTWGLGIVGSSTDWAFTVTNVLPHGVPYIWLLYVYARERAGEAPRIAASSIVRLGLSAFVGVALAFAFAEEVLWDRLVWHDRPEVFGGAREEPLLGPLALAFVVPLLAVPQATHYALDAFLWRRRDTGPAQAKALGFGPRRESSGERVGARAPLEG